MANSGSRSAGSGPKKPNLNFQPNGDSKLARAFRAIVGPAQPADYRLAQLKAALRELGFGIKEGQASHPVAQGRSVALPPKVGEDAMAETLAFIARHFPETEFHLPYILAKAKLQARLKAGGKLEPEPEYDDDGFLAT